MCSVIHRQLNCALSPARTLNTPITFCGAVGPEQNDTMNKDKGTLNSLKILLQLKLGSLLWHTPLPALRKEPQQQK